MLSDIGRALSQPCTFSLFAIGPCGLHALSECTSMYTNVQLRLFTEGHMYVGLDSHVHDVTGASILSTVLASASVCPNACVAVIVRMARLCVPGSDWFA